MKTVHLLYGREGMTLRVPDDAVILENQAVPALAEPARAIAEALAAPIGAPSLETIVRDKAPRSVAITISDATRPVPNHVFLPPLLEVLNRCGVADEQVIIIVGTGMHRRSTPEEHERLVGPEVLRRVEVIDHDARDDAGLVAISQDPPVYLNRRFAEADLRVVTGYIEGHFCAGYSGGRKGVCPALVDLRTIQRFHGYETLADPAADTGVTEGNPCHEIALDVARAVGVDFLLNVAITRDRQVAAVYAGDLEAAHEAGCRDVAEWTTAEVDEPADLLITNGGGFPLDETFYQSVKGMCTPLPAVGPETTMLEVTGCGEGVGSSAYHELMTCYAGAWQLFLRDIAASGETRLDQWQYQIQSRVLSRIGVDRLWLVTDGLAPEVQRQLSVTPILGEGSAQQRAQRAVDGYLADHPGARVVVVPEGPYTIVRMKS